MKNALPLLAWCTDRDEGQDLLEYGLLASLIATFVIGALQLVSDQVNGVLWEAIAAANF